MTDLDSASQAKLASALTAAVGAPTGTAGLLGFPGVDLGEAKGKATETLSKVITAVETILEYRWLIPDKYEPPLDTLLAGLTRVRGWIS